MNWVVPQRILALAGPTEDTYPIEEFLEYARAHNVAAVVRLNGVHYAAGRVRAAGIEHHDMFMDDGSVPAWEQIEAFCRIAERLWGSAALAVHCRAGLGRTGTMIAAYLIRKYRLDAARVVAYLRIMRPGSVLSVQARFLHAIQYRLRGEPAPPDAQRTLAKLCRPEPAPDSIEMTPLEGPAPAGGGAKAK